MIGNHVLNVAKREARKVKISFCFWGNLTCCIYYSTGGRNSQIGILEVRIKNYLPAIGFAFRRWQAGESRWAAILYPLPAKNQES